MISSYAALLLWLGAIPYRQADFPFAAIETLVAAPIALYTGYRLSLAWSWVLFAFLIFDLITLVLVLREWQTHGRLAASATRPSVSPPRV